MSIRRSLYPLFVPLVDECYKNDKINGQGHSMLAITGIKSSLLEGPTDGYCDRFTLAIPYCGTHIKWEVIFNHLHPTLPPDIIWSAEDEQTEFDPDVNNLKSLANWDHNDTSCLSRLLEELLEEYRRHHFSLLSSHQRLYFEFNTLKENNPQCHIDLHCLPSSEKGKYEPIARFYITLEVDFSTLPSYFTKDNPGVDFIALTVIFHPPNASKVETSLHLSSHVERILGSVASIKLPSWTMDSYLMDYVPTVQKLLQEKVESIVQNFVRRKEYFAAILNLLGQAVLEYDTEGFKKIAFLFENQGFCFIAQLSLSELFPSETPIVCLHSVYHKYRGRPMEYILTDMPYSTHWDAEEKAMRMKSHLYNVIPKFMDICKTDGEFL